MEETTNKTDLSKILSVSGQKGLFRYLAQGRNGAIVESLKDGRRTCFDLRSRITTLADISIYTAEGEMKLQEVFLRLNEALEGGAAPDPKAPSEDFKAIFAKAVPNYDEDRFYVSHMKKVAEWYNDLKAHASLDFLSEEESSDDAAPEASGDTANE